jgi:hypothetical protein
MTRRPTDIITALLAPLLFFDGQCKEKKDFENLSHGDERSRRTRRRTLCFLRLGEKR